MATRADNILDKAVIRTFKVVTANAVKGRQCKFGAADDEATVCGAGEQGMGVFLGDAVIGDYVSVAIFTSGAIVPVVVGTGGATRGSYAVAVANGLTNQAIATGTNARHIAGVFTQTGVAGDLVGLQVGPFCVFTA